jgi:hypothetical protein
VTPILALGIFRLTMRHGCPRQLVHEVCRWSVVTALVSLSACATTKVTSVRDPEAAAAYDNILIFAPLRDLDLRSRLENAFVSRLRDCGVRALPAVSVLPPTREYNGAEVGEILRKEGVDAVLLVRLLGASTEQTYIPPVWITSGSASVNSGLATFSSQTYQVGGFSLPSPRLRYELRLVDVATGKTAWLGTSLTRGDAFTDTSVLFASLATEAIQKMRADLVVR